MTQFFTEERWARLQRKRCLVTLDHMWRQEGYFCREPDLLRTKFAFTNYGVSIGLQAAGAMPERKIDGVDERRLLAIDHDADHLFLLLERIPVMWKRSLHVGGNWRILAD